MLSICRLDYKRLFYGGFRKRFCRVRAVRGRLLVVEAMALSRYDILHPILTFYNTYFDAGSQ